MASSHPEAEGGTEPTKKDFKSAVIIMPPSECWDQIQAIRSKHDKGYVRWMPHINLLFPFLADKGNTFTEAATSTESALSHIRPFSVRFTKDSFKYFKHKKSCTMWLNPLKTETIGGLSPTDLMPHPSVMDIQSQLLKQFPQCNDLNTPSESGFTPHLSLGQFPFKKVEQVIQEFQAEWQDIEFEVKEVCLISRENFEDPFHVRHTVPLRAGPEKDEAS